MNVRLFAAILFFTLLTFLGGCSDKGIAPETKEPPTNNTSKEISFQQRVKPIFQSYGCNGCHGGSGGLFVQTVAQLLQGGNHGPAIVPGKADSSNLIKKLSPAPPFGDRMPQGGPYAPDSTIQIIRTWINEGAKNN
jgi:hypothetical protein